jgi:hypothetical protein
MLINIFLKAYVIPPPPASISETMAYAKIILPPGADIHFLFICSGTAKMGPAHAADKMFGRY